MQAAGSRGCRQSIAAARSVDHNEGDAIHRLPEVSSSEGRGGRTRDFTVLSFDHLADGPERARLGTIPASYRLDRNTVDSLRALPARMLDASAQFRGFLQRVQAPPARQRPAGESLPD